MDRDAEFNKAAFDCLTIEREQIESEIGLELSWERLDNGKASRVAAYTDGDIRDSENDLAEIRKWMVEQFPKFKKVFGRRLVGLVN